MDSEKGISLIERIKQGQGKPSKIYVKSFMRDEDLKFENQTLEELVKEKFLQLGYSHIEYIMKCINENTTKVRNVKNIY